jgi:hypothetical protein
MRANIMVAILVFIFFHGATHPFGIGRPGVSYTEQAVFGHKFLRDSAISAKDPVRRLNRS